MPRRKKETFYTKIAPHVIPFVVGFSLFLSLFFISLKVYTDNVAPQEREMSLASIEPTQNPELQARTVHWETYTDPKFPFSIKYPQNKLKNTNDAPLFAKSGVCTKKEVQALTLEPVQFDTESLPHEIYAQLIQVTVHAERVTDNISIDDWFQTHCLAGFYQEEMMIKTTSSLHGHSVIQLSQKQMSEEEQSYTTGKTHRFVRVGDMVYVITTHYSFERGGNEEQVKQAEEMLNDMVETFEFRQSS